MAAPKGNEFWKQRGKHGRSRIIKDHKALLENANQYFQWCDDNPINVYEVHGKDANLVVVPKRRVFQKEAFAIYCGVSQWRTIEDLKNVSKDFTQVITYIETIIRSQKFEGAVIGQFKETIIARDLGLAEKKDITSDGEKLGFISPDTIAKIANKINGNSK